MSEQNPEDTPPPAYPTYPQEPAATPPYGQTHYDPSSYAQPTYGTPAYGQPAYGQQQYGYPAYGGPPVPTGARPGVVTTAHVLTWVALAVNLLGLLVIVLVFAAADRATILDALNDQDFDEVRYDDVRTAVIVIGVVLMVWAIAALAVSFASFAGKRWGRMTLAISGGLSVLVQLVAFAAILPVLTALATVAAIVMLFSRDANAWYGNDQLPPQYPPPYQQHPQYPPTYPPS